jgi:hypothetical protein
MNQAAVAQALQTRCGVDTLNPQAAHLTATLATVTVSVEKATNEGFVRATK